MDIFKGIGDFFGGLFGQKKKREDEQQQPQQQQSAVSFNSTPKLGDNFANNSSNPVQPQQPKEFAKSSVDLNPVKPVQPVQPQVNRDQERQQLANKYRQEETDRYNQGSDHAANFLNDIFSGGKTAQMRENTINQNIQNRVNAEMLRKYGPDDQQVKQNIAQTSQDINNNATSVNNFTKNYNNTVQQTVASPVSAVKGAANSVVETMPKVSGAVTELGANTIKLFDEDNQFANNLIDRVRADREKNIVRKTLNSATGLTDQDNKMAYGLGNSGTRMAIDAAMTPVTGGAAPALVHGVEAHSDMMDSLDNIEARKKAEAAAKGEAYTPSSFGSRYLASTANAGAQAAIEKLGIDNITGKIGGKFAKNMVGRAVTGALGEAGEEAAQQYAENFTKKLFDNKQNIHEGVAESALMGGIMGGAGKMAFGGMDSVKNPYKSNDMADGQQYIGGRDSSGILGDSFNPRNAYSTVNKINENWAKNRTAQQVALAKALDKTNGVEKPVNFGQLRNDKLQAFNKIMTERNQDTVNNPYVLVYPNVISKLRDKRIIQGGSTPEQVSDMAFSAVHNTDSKILPSKYPHIATSAKFNGDNTIPNANLAIYNDAISLKSVYPRRTSQIIDDITKNPPLNKVDVMGNLDGGEESIVGSTQSASGSSPFSARQISDGSNIAQNPQNVNAFNREYEPEIQDLQNAYRKYGDDFEFNLTPEQQANYEHLLRKSPRDSEGRYIDPATGEMTIDQTVDDSVKYRLPNDNSNLPEVNYTETEGTPIYRGQAQAGRGIIKNQTNFADSGNYENGAFFTDNLDTAHKYGDNILETRRNDKNTVSVQESDNLQAMANKRMDEIMRNPKLYDEMDEDEYDLLEQMALGRPEAFAQYTKKPFVETGDKFGESGEVVYFKGVDDDAGIIRFKQKAEAENLARVAKENLQARHQELTGDQSIAFNEWANELERRAQGFFDEKTGKITINDGDLNTLNHELGHKLLTRADNRAELLADIRNTVGDEVLNAKYGENYAQQVANMNPEERANLFAEEYLADGFSDYYNGILAGEDSQRLGAKLGIPPRVLATYDRIVEAIKGILGLQQDTLKQFYAQAETGKFAQNHIADVSKMVGSETVPAYKIHNTPQGKLVEIEGNPLDGVPYKDIPRRVKQVIAERFQGNSYQVGDTDTYAGVTARSKRELAYKQQQMDSSDYVKKATMSHNLDELIESMNGVRAVPNLKKDSKPNVAGYIYGDVDVKIGGQTFTARVNIEQNVNGQKIIYDISNIKRGGGESAAKLNSLPRSSNTHSIAQNGKNVNAVSPENRYLLNSTPETEQKTRKFAETVLDTDTPPKDFVKLMHAGDESLKYTPKKNSEMWNRATKSVQESPERVFNELENTRVANDETMAKGIALAKHYQAMGDDLKASELYVELAKKATEAGRTVQALSLMRRTTPEGILMSTMREVESYNDKMKNKPNKQINITPEQRAEFLGRLREAYAMPEGN